MRKLHTISLEFCKMLQQITQSVTLTDHPFFKSLLTSFESLSLLNSCLTQLHLRNKETADPSSLVQTPLRQNKTTPLQFPFTITLTFCRKKNAAAISITHTSHALDIWHVSRCLPRDYFKSGLWGTGCPGCCDCLYTPSYMQKFPPGFVCL